jgi:hypothetical protein
MKAKRCRGTALQSQAEAPDIKITKENIFFMKGKKL